MPASLSTFGLAFDSAHDSDDACAAAAGLRPPFSFGAMRVEWEITPPRHARAILFAFDGVLCDLTGWLRWAHTMLPRFGVRCGFAEFRRVWDRRWRHRVAVRAIGLEAAVDECLAYWLIPAEAIPELRAAIVTQARRERAECRLLPGVKASLRELHAAGWTLGLHAELPESAAELTARLTELDVADCFASIRTTGDSGNSLGDESCYRAAIDALEADEPQAVFVGSAERDLEAADDLGWWTVACNAVDSRATQRLIESLANLPTNLPQTTPQSFEPMASAFGSR